MADIIEMPKLSDTMTVGTLVKWLKKEGDAVKSGDMLAEVETDKATMELESFFDGTLVKIFSPEGSQVEVGGALCAIGEKGEKVEAPAPPAAPAVKEKPAPETKDETESDEDASPSEEESAVQPEPPPETEIENRKSEIENPAPAPGGRLKISPLARKLATAKGLDPSAIKGSGPGGRIVRADILTASQQPKATSARSPSSLGGTGTKGPIQEEKKVTVSNMRGVIAKRLLESKTTIPHFYLEVEVDAAPLLALRGQLNEALAGDGVKLSVNDFILKASAEALRRVPAVNASWAGKTIDYHGAAHVSFAVAIEDGLITPVVRHAHDKSVFAISTEVKDLARAAKAKKLAPNQYTGGTFCVSNLGMMGIDRFSAIINPPNAAILAVGTTVTKPVVRDGQIAIGQRMSLTLSCDHRVVDGALGAEFLTALRDLLEKPALLLL